MNPREEARERGAHKYHGAPCKRGHDGWRYTRSAECVRCCSERDKRAEFGIDRLRLLSEAAIREQCQAASTILAGLTPMPKRANAGWLG